MPRQSKFPLAIGSATSTVQLRRATDGALRCAMDGLLMKNTAGTQHTIRMASKAEIIDIGNQLRLLPDNAIKDGAPLRVTVHI